MLKQKYKMDKLRIGIQGVAAAFHDMAARNYFIDRDVELVEFRDFRTLSERTANKEVDYSIMAIEYYWWQHLAQLRLY